MTDTAQPLAAAEPSALSRDDAIAEAVTVFARNKERTVRDEGTERLGFRLIDRQDGREARYLENLADRLVQPEHAEPALDAVLEPLHATLVHAATGAGSAATDARRDISAAAPRKNGW